MYGAGFLTSEKIATEIENINNLVIKSKMRENNFIWELSEREKDIIKKLGK